MQPFPQVRVRAFSILLLLLIDGKTARALFGFGKQSDAAAAQAAAKEKALELIRDSCAGDQYVPPSRGVGREDAARFTAAREAGGLRCGDSVLVPWRKVNDDFCDCPDGLDEPGTSACSRGSFECVNRGHQPARLPSSRVDDSICDCCDGSDERGGRCPNTCDEASEAWMQSLAERVVKAEQGARRREEYKQQAAEAAASRQDEIEDTRAVEERAKDELDQARKTLQELEDIEKEEGDAKLAQAEKAITEKVGATVLDAERLTALAIAVASAEEPATTLERVWQGIADGADVGDVLTGLLDATDKSEPRSKRRTSSSREKEDFLHEDYGDDYGDADVGADLDGDMDMDHYVMHLDDDFGYGEYHGYGYDEYGGDFGMNDYGDATHDVGSPAADGDAAGNDDAHAPDLDAEQAAHAKKSPIVVADEDGEGVKEEVVGDAEDEPRDGTARREEKKSFKPPRQFKNFKYETPEAVEARQNVKKLSDDVKRYSKKLKTLEDEAGADFGEDGVLWPLKDKCISTKAGGYEYKVCPYKDAHQEAGKSKTSIGKWKGIERTGLDLSQRRKNTAGEELLVNGDVLVFDRGQKCWNGPARTLRVELACGPEDSLSSVEEPETCAYTAVLETPSACTHGMRDALLTSAKSRRGDDFRRKEALDGVVDEL